MHCCIPTPTTDSNTSTGMIWVTLNMPSAAEETVLQTIREMSDNFTLSGEWSPCLLPQHWLALVLLTCHRFKIWPQALHHCWLWLFIILDPRVNVNATVLAEFSRAGNKATQTVYAVNGALPAFTHDMEPQLRKLGLPTCLEKGQCSICDGVLNKKSKIPVWLQR